MIEALFTILGTIIGFGLSELATFFRKRREDKRFTESVKTILKLEIDLNLQMFGEFWSQVNQLNGAIEDLEARKRRLARRLIEVPLPALRKEALQSQFSLLAWAISEQEVIQVFQFYDRLGKLETI